MSDSVSRGAAYSIRHTSVAAFLDDALGAAVESDYAGMAVLIARTADAAGLQDGVVDHFVSIDDVTAEHILVITRGRPSRRPRAVPARSRPGWRCTASAPTSTGSSRGSSA